jgi:NAD(P)-dependent dehydrogenase (short-subunit alcohol dehydrogenase family)
MSPRHRDEARRGDPPRDESRRQKAASATADAPRTRGARGRNGKNGKNGSNGRTTTDRTTRAHREIQREVDQADQQKKKSGHGDQQSKKKQAVQAGTREQPATPLPQQHHAKPGLEANLEPRPNYLAPDYRGSGKLQDMAAIVTGGDSGIGRAVAVLFAREGADVAIIYLPSEQRDADETRDAIEREGRRCLLMPGDVTDFAFCESAVESTHREFGRLDILVNNAAFQEHTGSIEDLSLEHFDRTIKTNLYGYFHMAKAVVPYLDRGSAIINTGSVTGLLGSKELLDYSTTKGGIHAFTRSLAQSLIEKGIRVNAVAPGPVWTPLNPADKEAEKVAEFGADVPMKRPAQPEELSPIYVFLAAPVCSSYITGEIFPVIGGYSGS